jgi:hypothetical protein
MFWDNAQGGQNIKIIFAALNTGIVQELCNYFMNSNPSRNCLLCQLVKTYINTNSMVVGIFYAKHKIKKYLSRPPL